MNQKIKKYIPKRAGKNSNKHIHVMSFLIILVIFGISICHNTVNSASKESPQAKCYKSIQIQTGDSLWSIAKQYYTDDWDNINIFIEEIKMFNGISNDNIHIGNYLAIPYYKDTTID